MKQKGFSLIELLVVVAIILIIASIAIPALLQARKSANESSAVANLRSLASAEFTYASRNNQRFGKFTDLYNGGYVDSRWSAAGKVVNGYTYTEDVNSISGLPTGAQQTTPDGFSLMATHISPAGDYDFEVGMDGAVRYGKAAPSGYAEGTPVGQR